MGIFSFLSRKPVIMEDGFFGRLTQESCDFSASRVCWYAESVLFTPIGDTIMCMIDAESTSSLLAQCSFFKQFEELYSEVLQKIRLIVESEVQWMALDVPIIDFEMTHRLAGLTIPQLTSKPVKWELWFEPVDTQQWGYTVIVDMIDNIPQPGIGISA
ncbi:hypothetical protein [Hymenobacter siberiensis]|jgi:hypothetical protein|uniref:hypothetical protein n=1 Tax=Hymenobacter siberiensis TaxID=2848396 RepID=UPI001C1E4699|nr:hypothetical protein [Hymenobacter siberiensis]MBU6121128.1 hypothetical protein [Hymenobacter siberiensis]